MVGAAVKVFKRAKVKGNVIHSEQYTKLKKRINNCVALTDSRFGDVVHYFTYKDREYAVVRLYSKYHNKQLSNRECKIVLGYLNPLRKNEVEKFAVVYLEDILTSCIKIQVNDIFYLSLRCNNFQQDL